MEYKNFLPKNTKQFIINGPHGKLDCIKMIPNNNCIHNDVAYKIQGVAIVFHPDSKGGGSYHNKVVQTIAKYLLEFNYIVFCPNLRGVGLSDGIYDNGIGEIDDAINVYEYVTQQYSNLPIILAGFSFGGYVANQLSIIKPYQYLILIAPAVTRYEIIIKNTAKTFVICGKLDEIISPLALKEWRATQQQIIHWVDDTGHFFHTKLNILKSLLISLNIITKENI